MASKENQSSKLQEMQFLEQNLQTASALKEIGNSKDGVYRIIGQLMIQTEKKKMIEELKDKEKILNLRIKSIEKQEKSLIEQLEKYREEVMNSMKK